MAGGDSGLFQRQMINFQPPAPITHLVACNNYLILAMQNGKIRLIPIQEAEKQEEYDVISSGARDSIAYIHLDPTGQHLIVSTATAADVFYFCRGQTKLKNLTKLKGNVISAIAWNQEISKQSTTGAIILGTTRGLLFETEILSNGNVSYFRQLFCFSDDPHQPLPVVSVIMHGSSSSKDAKWYIFVTLSGRLYPFTGTIAQSGDGPLFHSIFQPFQENPPRFHSLTATEDAVNLSELHLFPQFGDEPASRFAWLAGPGLEYGKVDGAATDPFKIIVPEKFYSYPTANSGRQDLPLHFVMTDYHFVLLYNDRVNAICVLNEAVVYDDHLGQKFGKLLGIWRDPVSGFIWVYSDRHVLKYTPNNETRNLWWVYLDQGDFNSARKFAAGSQKNLDVVLQKQAEKLMKEKK